MKLLNLYFRRPILYDYLFACCLAAIVSFLLHRSSIASPKSELLYSMVSDLSTVALTLAGFLLTLVTVLISFKSSSKVKPENVQDDDSVFDIFFASALYFQTIRHLQSGISSLVFVAIVGYVLKLSITETMSSYLLAFNLSGMSIIVFTLARGIIILGSVVKMQRDG